MIYLCLGTDIPEGGFRCFNFLSQKIVATKTNGKILVDQNRCRHRGFPVADDAGGQLPIVCPYHGMRFFPTGEIPSFRIFNFVFFGDGEIELHSGERALMLSATGDPFHEETHPVEAPFFLWMQNTMDPNHLSHVHGEGFAKSFEDPAKPYDVWISENGSASAYKIAVKEEVVRSYSRMLNGVEPHPYFHHLTFYPHLSITSFMGIFFSVETATPTTNGKCEVRTRFFSNPSYLIPPPLLKAAVKANKQILAEDRKICERWAKGFEPNGGDRLWLPGEERIQAYMRTCYRERIGC